MMHIQFIIVYLLFIYLFKERGISASIDVKFLAHLEKSNLLLAAICRPSVCLSGTKTFCLLSVPYILGMSNPWVQWVKW